MPDLRRLTFKLLVLGLTLAPLSAHADMFGAALGYLGLATPAQTPKSPATTANQDAAPVVMLPEESGIGTRQRLFSAHAAIVPALAMPQLPSAAVAELPTPAVETPLKKLFCVEYARARSGLALFGDAKFWWARAKNLYARMRRPAEETVMVFTASKRLTKGHVAVVTQIVSAREIRVDQANWQNHGEIDHSTPVLDVSKKNDWSQVRVWDMGSQSFGGHVYAISGFIAKDTTERLARE